MRNRRSKAETLAQRSTYENWAPAWWLAVVVLAASTVGCFALAAYEVAQLVLGLR